MLACSGSKTIRPLDKKGIMLGFRPRCSTTALVRWKAQVRSGSGKVGWIPQVCAHLLALRQRVGLCVRLPLTRHQPYISSAAVCFQPDGGSSETPMIDHQRYRNAADRLSAELPFPNTLGTFGWPVFQSLDAHRHRRDVTGAASAPLCTDTPRKASALCPATRKNSEIMKPSRTARVAMPVRSRGDRFLASEMKIGSTPNGSTTTSRVRECGKIKLQ